jgi:integrase
VIEKEDRDLRLLVVRRLGSLVATGDLWEPYRLLNESGTPVMAAVAYFGELQAAGRSTATQRSYGMDLLRWFRFLWAVEIPWWEATRTEARDFSRWIQVTAKPVRSHWRSPDKPPVVKPKAVNPVTGKRPPGRNYAPSTVAHCETVLRSSYAYHLEAGTGLLVNPFPLGRAGRAHAHHNPMDPFQRQRVGLYRPRQPQRIPRQIPDEVFNELFARLSSDRDRALVAFWVSTGTRATELLGALRSGADPGQQLITVVRKGSRAIQQLPASPDAFVWLRLYQQQTHNLVPEGPDDPLWWTLRRPLRPLNYHAARAMFVRANDLLGSNYSLHDLRHSAAYRLARDPDMPITDIQWVLGHSSLSTTQIYTNSRELHQTGVKPQVA